MASFLGRLRSPRTKQGGGQVSVSLPLVPNLSPAAPNVLPYATRGFDANTVVNACVRELATLVAAPTYVAERRTGDGGTEAVADDLVENPNPAQSMPEFVELLVTYLMCAGNAYVLRERGRSGAIVGLQLLRPDRVTVALAGGKVSGYSYEIDGQDYPLQKDDVAHMRIPNPADDVYGLSPLSVCARYLNLDISVANFLSSYFANAGVPAGILKLQRRINSQQEADAARSRWRSSFSGTRGWHGLAVLDSDAEYQKIAPSLKDMDAAAVTRATETRICAVFGVPPILIGLQSGLEVSSYSNYEQARESFVSETVSPLVLKVAAFLTRALALDKGVNVRGDTSGAKAWTEDISVASTRVVGQFAAGIITLNEARAALGFEALEDGERRQVSMSVMEIDMGNGVIDSGALSGAMSDAKRLPGGALAADHVLRAPAALPRARALSIRLGAERDELADNFEELLQRYFNRLKSSVAGRLGRIMERGSGVGETKALPSPGDILPAEGREALKGVVRQGYSEVVQSTWDTVAGSGVAGAVVFDPKLPIIRQLIGPAEVAATEIWASTEAAVARSTELAVERGYSIGQLARGVPADRFPGINSIVRETYQHRARTIARTEVMRAQNATTLGYYAHQGIEYVVAHDPDGDSNDNFVDNVDGRTCRERHEQVYPAKEASNILSHPNCRLTWTPLSTEQVNQARLVGTVATD